MAPYPEWMEHVPYPPEYQSLLRDLLQVVSRSGFANPFLIFRHKKWDLTLRAHTLALKLFLPI